jgi:hypothetical protein
MKRIIHKVFAWLGMGNESEIGRPSDHGTGDGTDRGEQYVRRPRASGVSKQERQRPGLPHESAPGAPSPQDFQPGGDDVIRGSDRPRNEQEGQ